MSITIAELISRLDAIGWEEQMDFEAGEKGLAPPGQHDTRLDALAVALTSAGLDALEREPGYLVWALRLAPKVRGGDASRRAERHAAHPDRNVRYWAERIRCEIGGDVP